MTPTDKYQMTTTNNSLDTPQQSTTTFVLAGITVDTGPPSNAIFLYSNQNHANSEVRQSHRGKVTCKLPQSSWAPCPQRRTERENKVQRVGRSKHTHKAPHTIFSTHRLGCHG